MSAAKPVRTKPINELRDQLSRVIAEIEATGESVSITRHGRVVAVLGPPPSGVVLGAGARPGVTAPSVHELAWSSRGVRRCDRGPNRTLVKTRFEQLSRYDVDRLW